MRFAQHHLHFHHLGRHFMVISKKLSLITIGILISILLISPHRSTDFKSFHESRFNFRYFISKLRFISTYAYINYFNCNFKLYIFTTFQNKLAKILTLLISFIFTLIKPMNSCQKRSIYVIYIRKHQNHKPMGMANNEGNEMLYL